ncbi:MAG: hypothetical protein AB7U98_08795 [Candidatus Nitrosocosmicus sp.]|jgi:hypothetical protein|uniref:hypothetical protein n=1 Tax=Candidatus Nitrosocosmicus sp. FF01 TaxID=3397670 RepID=UPI002ACC6822|nr:hypothetical protein YTPLAS21_18670 [Candidatus Nitrosocosmicus sp.]
MDREEVIRYIEYIVKKRTEDLEKEKDANPDNDSLLYMNNTAIRNYIEVLKYVKENLK